MRDNFRPNVRLTTHILMIIGTFLIAFNLSKISTGASEVRIRKDCARAASGAITEQEFVLKYNLGKDSFVRRQRLFCVYYQPAGIMR